MDWIPISEVRKHVVGRKMFVVKAFHANVGLNTGYTTDPYCVWVNDDDTFSRWPHSFPPTHFCVLPDDVSK